MTNNSERPIWCKHHRSPSPMQHLCAVGVSIDALVETGMLGRHYALPCHTSSHPDVEKLSCDRAEWPTQDEET